MPGNGMISLIRATAGGRIGPYDAADFEIGTGACSPESLTAAGKFYFRDECIALPRAGIPVAGFGRQSRVLDDVAAWSRNARLDTPGDRPQLVLLGAPMRVDHARLAPGAQSLALAGAPLAAFPFPLPLSLAPRLALNRSWFDASSAAFLAGRPLRLRAALEGEKLVASTFWPADFSIAENIPVEALTSGLPATLALRQAMREDPQGGAALPFSASVIWERDGSVRGWKDKPALVIIVNGAQGDDDEAWAGHFAIGTGCIGADGGIADLLVDNFYALDIVSEKGILAAPVPLDAYFGDLNRGQAWYRPSFILVAALTDEAVPRLVQGAFNRAYPQFWRHQLEYRHSTMNCTGISIDVLRALGLAVPARSPEHASRAWFALPWVLLRERSLAKARLAFEYLSEDATRLFPAAAFEEIGATLLRLARAGASEQDGLLGGMLARDLEALALLRIPQFPSSRTFGSAPVVAAGEYLGVVPSDPADMQVVPVPARPFPAALRDADLLPAPARPSDFPVAVCAAIAAIAVIAAGWMLIRALVA
jgi:hypothetical protein